MLCLSQCTKGLKNDHLWSTFLCFDLHLSLIHFIDVSLQSFFSRIGFRHNKCLALSVGGYFHITETSNNNQFMKPPCLIGYIINKRMSREGAEKSFDGCLQKPLSSKFKSNWPDGCWFSVVKHEACFTVGFTNSATMFP